MQSSLNLKRAHFLGDESMFYKKQTTTMRQWLAAQESHYKKEIGAVVLSGMFFFVAAAFFSYDPCDNTLFHYAHDHQTYSNWSGVAGANVAALFFYLLGAASYLFVLSLLFPLCLLFFKVPFKQEKYRLIALASIVLVTTFLCAVYDIQFLHGRAGGFIGALMASWLARVIGMQGLQLFLWAALWISCCIFLRVSLVSAVMLGLTWFIQWCKQGFISIKLCLWSAREQHETVIASGASKTATFNDENEQDASELLLASDPVVVAVNNEKPKLDILELQKFLTCSLRTTTTHVIIMNVPYVRIANTVLKHHLFIKNEAMQQIPYDVIYDYYQQHNQQHAFALPSVSLFTKRVIEEKKLTVTEQAELQAKKIEEKLQHFGIKGSVVGIKPGPVVTMFEYKPDIDSKISKIVALEDDLAMVLTAQTMRILAPIPGKNVIGFEIANQERQELTFASLVSQPSFVNASAGLPMILGVDIAGEPVQVDLSTMPHLLVGGATGSGKSVGLNVMLMSLLCKLTPDELKLILIDPKRLEFTPYADIPHLLFPIVTQPSRAASVLAWVIQEMEERYDAMAAVGVRGVQEYRKLVADMQSPQEGFVPRSMPYIVVIIDELADLMMVAGKEVEIHIVRIAQMARAAGIHVIVATQRPSVDVVTGLLKVNFPSRIAFRVSSKIDSRTILDSQGAEKLLGKGDMLFMHASSPTLKRVHGPYLSDHEVERVTDFLRLQRSVEYLHINEVLLRNNLAQKAEMEDELYDQVREFVRTMDEISISMIQRHYRIGFNRSARLIQKLELDGLIAPAQGSKPRKVIR